MRHSTSNIIVCTTNLVKSIRVYRKIKEQLYEYRYIVRGDISTIGSLVVVVLVVVLFSNPSLVTVAFLSYSTVE